MTLAVLLARAWTAAVSDAVCCGEGTEVVVVVCNIGTMTAEGQQRQHYCYYCSGRHHYHYCSDSVVACEWR